VGHQYDLGFLGTRSFFCHIVINNSSSDHFLDRNLELAQAIGVPVSEEDRRPVLALPAAAARYADAIIEKKGWGKHHPLVGIHPGSGAGMKAKRWPTERYAALSRLLCQELEARVIVFEGPDEGELAQSVRDALSSEVELHAGGTFLQTAAVVGRCHLFIANDTALMHAATALDVPTIALFGPTDPEQNGPYGTGHVVIRKPLPCSPCYRLTDYRIRCHIAYECMRLITVEEVLAHARRMVSVSALERRLT
ncbi:MAG: glycosyltransferase family 9 protein, partial [Candidatus Binatia bacterium]